MNRKDKSVCPHCQLTGLILSDQEIFAYKARRMKEAKQYLCLNCFRAWVWNGKSKTKPLLDIAWIWHEGLLKTLILPNLSASEIEAYRVTKFPEYARKDFYRSLEAAKTKIPAGKEPNPDQHVLFS